MAGVREPLTRLLELMEEFGPTGQLPLNDPRVTACYRELYAIVDAHPPASPAPAGAAADPDLVQVEAEGVTFMVKPTDKVGGPGRCRSCQALVMWVEREPAKGGDRKPHPLNRDGVSHFATCPQADRWRSR